MQTVSVDALEGAYQGMADTRSSRGVTYTYNFMQTLLRIDHGRHGFTVEDIEAPEALWHAWADADVLWEGGYVLRLKDGRRVYVQSYSGEGDWMADAKVTAEMLPASRRYPKLPDDHYQTMFGWSESVEELEEFLARLAA
jgi:hypothetical protein